LIKAQSLRVDYGDLTAVRDLDLSIGAGDIYGLIGPNGAGKTSTIKALAGVLEPTYGEVALAGVDALEHREEAHRHLGYMPDFPPLYEDLKVWEYLDVFALAYAMSGAKRKERTDRCIEAVRLQEKRDVFVKELSRGMRQRLVLAKTILHEPDILLLDEPASGLDPVGRVEMRNILKDLAQKGAAILISSHILAELSDFCTSVGIMEKGRLVISGTLDSILARIGSTGILHVQVTTPHPAVAQVLGGTEAVTQLEVRPDGSARGLFRGTDADAAKLVSQLVGAGASVSSFHVEKEDIEGIFMRIGAKEVS
jgi:ABC-2 type transport system ATP-binding protein